LKQSNAFIHTLRDAPRDADVASQQLMTRAGMIQKISPGIYTYLPLALRAIRKLEHIVRAEMAKEGCQEVLMPTVQPAELWRQSGRWSRYGSELLRFKDRRDIEFCLGPTHEEVITDVMRRTVRSYKQLPVNLFQIQTKFRDELRPRFGLMRGREFIMKDGYSFHVDDADADDQYWKMHEAYQRIFRRVGVEFRVVEADSGAIGGSYTHEFHVLAQSGEDSILSCSACSYTSNIEKTQAAPTRADIPGEIRPLELDRFATPQILDTHAQIATMVDDEGRALPISRGTKTFFLRASGERVENVVLVIRADHEPNLAKLRAEMGVDVLEPMAAAEAEALARCPVGFFGPLGIPDARLYVDSSLDGAFNLTCGANKPDLHHYGVSPRRDLPGAVYGDYRMAQVSDVCARCGAGTYRAFRGIEVGQVFKLGTKYSAAMNCTFTDAAGLSRPMVMGCYGIGISRTIAALIEQSHDAVGMIWPWSVAPYELHILNLDVHGDEVSRLAFALESQLESAGFDVLHDERDGLSAGEKFKDADLLGFPVRITVGPRAVKSGLVEIRDRKTRETTSVAAVDVLATVNALRQRAQSQV
jgi:prolyl-tRNA synthetase